jgi:hypothetical protein
MNDCQNKRNSDKQQMIFERDYILGFYDLYADICGGDKGQKRQNTNINN